MLYGRLYSPIELCGVCSWQLTGHDEIQDDVEDRRIARRAERGELDLRSDEEGRRISSARLTCLLLDDSSTA